jgi:hypothetical protein
MELKTETKIIDGLKFYINQFPARKCIKLEKKTLTYIAPMLNILEGIKSLDSDIDLSKIAKCIQEVLMNISEEALEQFITEMVENTTVEISGESGKKLTLILADMNNFDKVFIGKNMTVYKLLIEIMRVNKFGFFELVGGSGINITGLFNQTNKG